MELDLNEYFHSLFVFGVATRRNMLLRISSFIICSENMQRKKFLIFFKTKFNYAEEVNHNNRKFLLHISSFYYRKIFNRYLRPISGNGFLILVTSTTEWSKK